MHKVLIVSRIFAPKNSIGAIRPTKFGKYLTRNGYIVDVIAEDQKGNLNDSILNEDLDSFNKIIRLTNSKFYNKINDNIYKIHKLLKKKKIDESKKIYVRGSVNKLSKLKNHFKKFLKYTIILVNEYNYYREFKKLNMDFKDYQYMFSTYSTLTNHMIGKYIKRKAPHIKWVADFRDPVYQNDVPKYLEKYFKKFANNYCKKAEYITSVSEGCLENLFIENYKGKKVLIYNGFDNEDLVRIEGSKQKVGKFSLAYTGQLYWGQRDITPLFKALFELIEEKLIDKNEVIFNYAGKDFIYLLDMASKYGLTNILNNFKEVNRSKSIEIQMKSHMLVLASWNTKTEKGVITGKLLEYMMIKKPVVGLVSGEVPNSKIKDIINECNIGVTYENANANKDFYKLKKYILFQYNNYKENAEVDFKPDLSKIERFEYKHLTQDLIRLFRG
ncbi:hypothetical protein ACTWQL_04710 [Pseudalkalibacillus sp. R45]|uniref:hypothetical protein n=1 Tax=Pseudalkalibacillus sp. R45 TaxID=3457433 RepID=UPI003FCC3A83